MLSHLPKVTQLSGEVKELNVKPILQPYMQKMEKVVNSSPRM